MSNELITSENNERIKSFFLGIYLCEQDEKELVSIQQCLVIPSDIHQNLLFMCICNHFSNYPHPKHFRFMRVDSESKGGYHIKSVNRFSPVMRETSA